jgi:hypothetical protein
MRIFLFLILFDMIFHSLAVLTPYKEWCKELRVDTFPERLPTLMEMEDLAGKATPKNPAPAAERVMKSLNSVWDFCRPWPDVDSRPKIQDWPDRGKYLICWLTTRLEFCEHLAGINQEWVMFSPNVAQQKTKPRAWLHFADGSTRQVWQDCADPPDLTRYGHWFVDRINNYEVDVTPNDPEACLGFCNLLANRHRTNEQGQRLMRIELKQVTYQLPGPGMDAKAFLREQTRSPAKVERKAFFIADMKTHSDGSVSVTRRKGARPKRGQGP